MANRPKGKLMALLAIFAAIGIVTATGAFTSVQAERTVDVATAGDASANLAIESINSTSDNYVVNDGDTVSLDFTNVNLRSKTDFGAILKLTNNIQSGSTVYVQIATRSNHLSNSGDFGTFVNDGGQVLKFEANNSKNIMGGDATTANESITLSSGESDYVHVSINTLDDGTTAQTLVSGEVFVIYASQNDPAS